MKKIFVAVFMIALTLSFLTGFGDANGPHGYYGGAWRHGGHGGWYARPWHPGAYAGVGFGAGLYPGYVMRPQVYGPPPYAYYQTIPGHWERRSNPYRHRYMNVYAPQFRVPYPY